VERAVNPWETLGRERAPDGGELVLYERNGEFVIRVDGHELMSSRGSNSEEEMARMAVARLAGKEPRPALRLLVGGLGMGYTTRAALDALGPGGEVVVAEIVPAVVAWNRGPLAHLARRPLEDKRARVEVADVGRVIANTKVRFDAILLDVDNGPRGLTRKSNQLLYTDPGLASAKRALKPGGLLAVWSASPDSAFVKRLRKAGLVVDTVEVPARGKAGGPMHTVFFGRA
jgi:spermidine synthase